MMGTDKPVQVWYITGDVGPVTWTDTKEKGKVKKVEIDVEWKSSPQGEVKFKLEYDNEISNEEIQYYVKEALKQLVAWEYDIKKITYL